MNEKAEAWLVHGWDGGRAAREIEQKSFVVR